MGGWGGRRTEVNGGAGERAGGGVEIERGTIARRPVIHDSVGIGIVVEGGKEEEEEGGRGGGGGGGGSVEAAGDGGEEGEG